jgi:hypothetical protein
MGENIFALIHDENGNETLFGFPDDQVFAPNTVVEYMTYRGNPIYPECLSVDDFIIVGNKKILQAKEHIVFSVDKDVTIENNKNWNDALDMSAHLQEIFRNECFEKSLCSSCIHRNKALCSVKSLSDCEERYGVNDCYSYADSITMRKQDCYRDNQLEDEDFSYN